MRIWTAWLLDRVFNRLVRRADALGDYLEFGVYVGTSMLCMQRAADAVGADGMRLFGFERMTGRRRHATPS